MKKINHIVLILILSVLFIFIVSSPPLSKISFFPLIGLLLIIGYIFYKKKAKKDLYLVLFILLTFLTSRIVFRGLDDITLIIRTSSILAFFLLNIVLLIGPLSHLSDKFVKYYTQRRHIGVTVFLLAWVHSTFIIINFFNKDVKSIFFYAFTFFGYTGFFVMMFLALTSWDSVQKKIKLGKWKLIHAFTLLTYLGLFSFFLILQKSQPIQITGFEKLSFYLFILFWIIIAPYKHLRIFFKTWIFGWKQLHLLMYVAYISIVIHVFEARLVPGLSWLKYLVIPSIVIIVGVHLVGWIKKFSEDKKIYSKINVINKSLKEGNKTYIGLSKVSDFVEGKGQKFYLDKKPIAVFKSEGKFYAFSNICAHQKGPIYKGKIQYGYVECPWHYHMFSIKDGKGPKEFGDCIPHFETKVKDDILYVATTQSFDCKKE